jgi:hypothetical protein
MARQPVRCSHLCSPAQAGAQLDSTAGYGLTDLQKWVPAAAGMTKAAA